MTERWTVEQAQAWAKRQAWYFGANFYPSTAINQLEMWQRETFDPVTIERELGYAAGIGMNIMRVYLHDLIWEHDREGFIERIEQYLSAADRKGIKTMFCIFDDCWNAEFSLGPQPAPIPYTHNSGWVQSPGHKIVEDPAQWPRLERYVKELLEHFKADPRIAVWDLYNEPTNAAGDPITGKSRPINSIPLLKAVFEWARSVDGLTQPVTAGCWNGRADLEQFLIERSDIVTFHGYSGPDKLRELIDKFQAAGRPIICTEWLARGNGSTFADCLPVLRKHCAGAINWGLVSGKTQTIYPWGWSEEKGDPPVWFHDVFNPDGSFLYPEEEGHIRRVVNPERITVSCKEG